MAVEYLLYQKIQTKSENLIFDYYNVILPNRSIHWKLVLIVRKIYYRLGVLPLLTILCRIFTLVFSKNQGVFIESSVEYPCERTKTHSRMGQDKFETN